MRDFFPTGESAKTRRQFGEADRRGQGAAGAQRKATKRCEGAAGIESHGIDQKPERQESARTGDRCASALAFFVFRLMTQPLCRYSSFLPFPSGLRDLPRRPGHKPELPPCLRRRPALNARGIDVDAVGRHGPIRTHFPRRTRRRSRRSGFDPPAAALAAMRGSPCAPGITGGSAWQRKRRTAVPYDGTGG